MKRVIAQVNILTLQRNEYCLSLKIFTVPARPGNIDGTLQRFATNRFHAEVGSRFGIDEFIYKNPSQLGIPVSDRLLATTVEAMVGAVWLDSGDIKAVEKVMLELGVLSPHEV